MKVISHLRRFISSLNRRNPLKAIRAIARNCLSAKDDLLRPNVVQRFLIITIEMGSFGRLGLPSDLFPASRMALGRGSSRGFGSLSRLCTHFMAKKAEIRLLEDDEVRTR